MAETVFADLFASFNLTDPREVTGMPFLNKHFKANQCAFPRHIVRDEVRRILDSHRELFAKGSLDGDAFITMLLDDWKAADLVKAGLKIVGVRSDRNKISLPKRFKGGLLFGQLMPRFDNRIIARCQITGEKVPNKHCLDFLDFRWAITLANIQIGFGSEVYAEGAKLRPLNAEERRKVDAAARSLGFLRVEPDKSDQRTGLVKQGKNELREVIIRETGCDRNNLETLLLHPDAQDALKLLPIKGDATAFRAAWKAFGSPTHDKEGKYLDDAMRRRFARQLLRGKELSGSEILGQLERFGNHNIAERIKERFRQAALDRKGKPDAEKFAKVFEAKFRCEKLKGRARFSGNKLRQAVQQVMNREKPVHPFEKGGCLEQTEAVKDGILKTPLSQLTNNHLVRHRLLILSGDQHSKDNARRKRGLLDDIITEFADGEKRRIGRITVELARDLQTMSGMTNKEKAKEIGAKISHHHDVAEWLALQLSQERDEKGRPFPITPGLIRKARVADDLDWECPYTGWKFEPADLVHGRFDKDHIIPRSQRLSDALEAIVITSREVNAEKKKRTALQFILDMNRPENGAIKKRLGIRTEAQFRDFVGSLKHKGPHSDDVARRDRRRKLLLVEKYEEQEFTPADLAKTRHIVKLAQQQLEGAFRDVPRHERPAMISITGAVTAAFRDKSWKVIRELAAIHPHVKQLVDAERDAREVGTDFNLKSQIRGVTHLHHAVDALVLGYVAHYLVGTGEAARTGLNGELCRLIVKAKLNAEERERFEQLLKRQRLSRYYIQGEPIYDFDSEGRLHINSLPLQIKKQIQQRLAEMRVVQHVSADMSAMRVEENVRGIVTADENRVYLRQQARDVKTGKLVVKKTDELQKKVMGFNPMTGAGKLKQINGVRVISDNFGVAILDHAKSADQRFNVIPFHKVWQRLSDLKAANAGKLPRVLRNGQLIRFKEKGLAEVWRVFSIKDTQRGVMLDIGRPDELEQSRNGNRLSSFLKNGFEILRTSYCGVPLCPITSSASMPRNVR